MLPPVELDRVDWQSASSAALAHPVSRSALDWARVVFDRAPTPVRAFLSFSWRCVLLLDVGRPSAADRVLGWRILESNAVAVLGARSRLGLDSRLAISVDDGRLVLRSFLHFRHRGARVLWTFVAPLHRMVVSLLVGRAARH